MKRTPKGTKAPSAEAIAKMADRGQDVLRFFTRRGKMMQPTVIMAFVRQTRSARRAI